MSTASGETFSNNDRSLGAGLAARPTRAKGCFRRSQDGTRVEGSVLILIARVEIISPPQNKADQSVFRIQPGDNDITNRQYTAFPARYAQYRVDSCCVGAEPTALLRDEEERP